jgi:ATP-binding cassette subfamily B protein
MTQQEFDFRQAIHPSPVKGLWKILQGYRLAYLFATIALAISAASKTLTYLLLRYFVNTLTGDAAPIGGKIETSLAWVAAGFVGLSLLQGGFSFASGKLAAYTAEGIARRLRDFLFDHIQRLSFSYHGQTPTGDLIQRVTSDVDAIRRFFSNQAIGVGRILLIFSINFAALCKLNLKLALVSVIIIPFVLGVSLWFFGKVRARYEAYQKQDAILSTTLQENLSGVRVVKAFARQPYEIEKFEKENWKKFLSGKHLLIMHSLFWPISDLLLGLQTIGGFLYAALLVIRGELTVGTYLAYVGLLGWLIWPIRNLGRLIVQTSTGIVSYKRVMEIIKQEREPLESGTLHPDKPVRGEIIFEHVYFQYEDSELPVLEDISFRCAPGDAIALLGSTGSGKTSLVNLLPRFYDYTGGHIYLDGHELRDYPRAYLRQQIGIVEQEPFLFSRSIRENIAYGVGREVAQEEIEEAARAAAIHDVILSFPDGYDTLVGEKGVTLSGGQKQRVAIARTLLKNPRILILDDSTSSVDTETEMKIRAALEKLMKGRTTFIIAHRIQSVMKANLILVLDKGKIVQKGTHEELLAQEGIYRQIYEIQAEVDAALEKEMKNGATHA